MIYDCTCDRCGKVVLIDTETTTFEPGETYVTATRWLSSPCSCGGRLYAKWKGVSKSSEKSSFEKVSQSWYPNTPEGWKQMMKEQGYDSDRKCEVEENLTDEEYEEHLMALEYYAQVQHYEKQGV